MIREDIKKEIQESAESFMAEVINSASARGYNVLVVSEGIVKYTGDMNRILYGIQEKEITDSATLVTVFNFVNNIPHYGSYFQPYEWVGLEDKSGQKYYLGITKDSKENIMTLTFIKTILGSGNVTTLAIIKRNGNFFEFIKDNEMNLSVPITTPVDKIDWVYAFDDSGPMVKTLVDRILSSSIKVEAKVEVSTSRVALDHTVTFKDLRKFLKIYIKSDVTPYYFEETEDRKWMVRQVNMYPSNEYTLYYIPQEGRDTPYPVAGFLFEDEPEGLICYLIPYDRKGNKVFTIEKIKENIIYRVKGTTFIDKSKHDEIVISLNNSWQNIFSDYFNGDVIRLALWTMISKANDRIFSI